MGVQGSSRRRKRVWLQAGSSLVAVFTAATAFAWLFGGGPFAHPVAIHHEGVTMTNTEGPQERRDADRAQELRNLGLTEEEIAEYDFDSDYEQEPTEDTEPPETPPSVLQGERGDWTER